jgi:hypothetical protein
MSEEDTSSSHTVQDSSYINDIRYPPEFKTCSFSKYKRTEVKNALIRTMLKGKIEPACYWCAELICAGHFMDIWEILLYYLGKYIHLGNPKIIVYLESRYGVFRNIMSNAVYTMELQLRNNINIRKLFAEIICLLIQSPKKPSFEQVRINRVEEFDIQHMAEKLRATDQNLIEDIFMKQDPKEIFIALNELAWHLSAPGSMMMSCYWIEWIMEFDCICRKNHKPCYGERRGDTDVAIGFQMDVIWIVWDVIFQAMRQRNKSGFIEKALHGLKSLFSIKYTTAACKRRRFLLYLAVALVTETVHANMELIGDKVILETVVSQINQIYREIKKKEESPQTDYLFGDMEKDDTQLKKSMAKLEMLNHVLPPSSTG